MKHLLASFVVIVSVLATGGSIFAQTSRPAYPLSDGKESVADYAKRAGIKDVQSELKLDANVSMKLTLIPAGKFLMGSPEEEQVRCRKDANAAGEAAGEWFKNEGPQHEVTISKPFYMGVYHVTKGQFATFVADSGYKTDAEKESWAFAWNGKKFSKVEGASWKTPGFEQTDDHPVVCVSHNDAVAFCQWLSKKTSQNVTLATEGQWEYSCRAGTTTAYQWGNDPDDGKGWCNAADQTAKKQFPSFNAFSWDDGYVFTSPVGRFKPNAFGLFDMHGNTYQWCSDWSDSYANANQTDPTGPISTPFRALRGGSWNNAPWYCRSAKRSWNTPVTRTNFLGFRVVVAVE